MTDAEILKSSFPNTIDKTKTNFCALICNEQKTGAIEKVLSNVREYTKQYTGTSNIYNQTGEMLEKTSKFFSYLEMYNEETETAFKKRLNTIFTRGGDVIWGSLQDVKNLFQSYFPTAKIFVCENDGDINENNKIINGEFNNSDNWVFNSDSLAYLDHEARFSQNYGVTLKNSGSIKQNVIITKESYLHFFYKGKCKIKITDENGKYWNNTLEYNRESGLWIAGKWQDDEYYINMYKSDDWRCGQTYIQPSDTESISIEIIGSQDEDTWVDYVRLYEYEYPCFTVFAQYEGNSDVDAIALAPGKDDKMTDPLDNYYYHDNDFLLGIQNGGYAQDLYVDLLKYVKSIGVRAYLTVINRDE